MWGNGEERRRNGHINYNPFEIHVRQMSPTSFIPPIKLCKIVRIAVRKRGLVEQCVWRHEEDNKPCDMTS